MSNHKIILLAAGIIVLTGACGKVDDNQSAAPDPQAPVTEEQVNVMEDATAGKMRAAEESNSRSAQSESGVTVRFGSVDYPMDFTEPENCGDFFGVSSVSFRALKPVGDGRVSKFTYNGNRETFTFAFWRDTVPQRFDPVDSDAHFSIVREGGAISGYEIVDGTRGNDINPVNINNFVAEGSMVHYEGPFSAGSDETITIDAVYCPH